MLYECTVIGVRVALFFLLKNGGSASSTPLFLWSTSLFLLFGLVQIQRPHLPDGHALGQGTLGEALARPLLAHLVAAHFVATARLLSQHVRHFYWFMLCFSERFFLFLFFCIWIFVIYLVFAFYIWEKIEYWMHWIWNTFSFRFTKCSAFKIILANL